MTAIEVTYQLSQPMTPDQVRCLSGTFAVYGLRSMQVDEQQLRLTIEYDATRLSEPDVAALVRGCRIAVSGTVEVATTAQM